MIPVCVDDVLTQLDRSAVAGEEPIWLALGDMRLKLLCAGGLQRELRRYFAPALSVPGPVDSVVEVLDAQQLASMPVWRDWAREPGKTGRKDAVYDLQDGRLVHKIRTGVSFVQSPQAVIAFGACADNPNQVVNFVNTQFLNHGLRAGWQICHAAAVTSGVRTLAIAGLSGGGKSTSVLRMMDVPGTAFVTNDRLLVRAGAPLPQALGIPKEPRINPGTILNNAKLHGLLDAGRLAELAAMPRARLWQLEEKYDLIISHIYGAGRVAYAARLTDFWVLNWQRESTEPTRVQPVDLAARPDLLAAIMKSAGPFYQKPDGLFLHDGEACVARDYLEALSGVRVCEVTGSADFDVIFQQGRALLTSE